MRSLVICFFFFQAEDGIRDLVRSRGLGDVYKRQTYIAANLASKEAIVVDPMKDDWSTLLEVTRTLKGYRFLAVIDTHLSLIHI